MATITNDFKHIVQQMAQQRVSDAAEHPVVRAGSVMEDVLSKWLEGLKLNWNVCIWMQANACVIGNTLAPDNPKLLEGARLFGEDGDLELWRAGAAFQWRFVGKKDGAPAGDDLPWPGDDLNPVYCQPRKALLWGERKGDETQWFDDRVAGAQLTYPGMGKATRVRVCYDAYSQAGRVLFVWLKRLEAYHG